MFVWSVHETKKNVWLCACKKKNWNFPYLPSQNVLTDFCQILHDNSTSQLNDIPDSFSISLVVFYLQRGQFAIFHILREWLLTRRSALPCIRVIITTHRGRGSKTGWVTTVCGLGLGCCSVVSVEQKQLDPTCWDATDVTVRCKR